MRLKEHRNSLVGNASKLGICQVKKRKNEAQKSLIQYSKMPKKSITRQMRAFWPDRKHPWASRAAPR